MLDNLYSEEKQKEEKDNSCINIIKLTKNSQINKSTIELFKVEETLVSLIEFEIK